MELLLEPLSHAFMVKALMISALVGGVCGLLSCFMTLKGWALMGDAVSHAVLPGVVVAYALGLPFSLGAFVFGVGSVAAIGFVKSLDKGVYIAMNGKYFNHDEVEKNNDIGEFTSI